jgi:hypothetical protein
MDRVQLEQVIDAGRSAALNCIEIGVTIPDTDPIGKLFRNEALNRSIFFKVMEQITSLHHTISIVQTLIYFPYNTRNVYEGGDSILFDDPAFHRLMKVKTAVDTKTRQGQMDYVMDLEIIEMLHSLPALDPFLFKSKAEQLDLLDRVHPNYFNIDATEWEAIRRPIRQKILLLVRSAFEGHMTSDLAARQMDKMAERFLEKIWEAKDIKGIEPFVNAMNVAPDKAPQLFFAWKAICFYQSQFENHKAELKSFFSWIGDDTLARPMDVMRLNRAERERLERRLAALRARIRHSYQKVIKILRTYEDSYRVFVEQHEPQPFREFLSSADDHYQEIAACLSAASHAAKIWREKTLRYGDRLNYEHYRSLIRSLCVLFDAKVHVTDARAAD